MKIVKPGPKPGKPIVEDYQGARTAKAIVDAVVEKIPNHVKRLQDKDFEAWLSTNADVPRAILFTEKGTVSALIRSLAVDFLGSITFGQIRSKEVAAVEKMGVKAFPSLVLVFAGSQEVVVFSGEMKKAALIEFLSVVASPNPDPPEKKVKTKTSKPTTASAAKRSTASVKMPKVPPAGFDDFQEIVFDDDTPLDSPIPIFNAQATPIPVPEVVAPIETLATPAQLESLCLASTSGTCILVLLPAVSNEDTVLPEPATNALTHFAELADKHKKRKVKLFPFYSIPAENTAAGIIRTGLGLKPSTDLEIVALNVKRGWWRLFSAPKVDTASLEGFIDSIKLGEGAKVPLPEGFYAEGASAPKDPEPEPEPQLVADILEDESPAAADPEPEAEAVPVHNEL